MTKLSEKEVRDLINQGESTFIDFKQEYYHDAKKLDLVHDILCLANADSVNDRYIIFGVNDDGTIKGLSEKIKDNDIIDCMRGAGINRLPVIWIQHFQFEENIISVLCIANISHKPYFLTKDKKNKQINDSNGKDFIPKDSIRAGVIYTRNGTTNTPKGENSSASEIEMEYMWRERFGLLLDPLTKAQSYLEESNLGNWVYSCDEASDKIIYYYKKFPEFVLEGNLTQDLNKNWPDSWNKDNRERVDGYKLGVMNVSLKYHSTILKKFQLISVECKLIIPVPTDYNSKEIKDKPAYIDTKSLECRIASIFDDETNRRYFCDYLRHGLRSHSCMSGLKIDIV